MTKQPEVLRLAEALECGTYLLYLERDNTAAELRRLHEVNAELLEALKLAYRYALDHADQEYPFDWAIYCENLYQAIAKAEVKHDL